MRAFVSLLWELLTARLRQGELWWSVGGSEACEGCRMWHRLGEGQEGARSAAGWSKVGAGRLLAESSAFQALSLLECP